MISKPRDWNLQAAFSSITRPADLACLLEAQEFTDDHYTPFTPVESPNLNRLIDHTILRPEATEDEVRTVCEEAIRHSFASVCVNGSFVPLAYDLLSARSIPVCAVVGFPLGAMSTSMKAAEAHHVVAEGATEVDMVIQVGMLKSGRFAYVLADIRAVVDVVKASKPDAVVKVILENTLLTDDEKVAGCMLARAAGARFVKTSTGFSKGGATPEDVALMRAVVGGSIGVKAAGGVRSFEDAMVMIRNGATRIGASSSVAIVQGEVAEGNY